MKNITSKKFTRNTTNSPKYKELHTFFEKFKTTKTKLNELKEQRAVLRSDLSKYDYEDPEYSEISQKIIKASEEISNLNKKKYRLRNTFITLALSLGLAISSYLAINSYNENSYNEDCQIVSEYLHDTSSEDLQTCDNPQELTTHALNALKTIIAEQFNITDPSTITITDNSFILNPNDPNISPEIRYLGNGYYTDITIKGTDGIISHINFFRSDSSGEEIFLPNAYTPANCVEDASNIKNAISSISSSQKNSTVASSKKALEGVADLSDYVKNSKLANMFTAYTDRLNSYTR